MKKEEWTTKKVIGLVCCVVLVLAYFGAKEYLSRPKTMAELIEERNERWNNPQSPEYMEKDLESISFDSEYDVRKYLRSHEFESDSGLTLRFDNNAYSLYINGRCVSSNVQVVRFHSEGAELRCEGPYGATTMMLVAKDGIHGITDMSDNTYYKAIE